MLTLNTNDDSNITLSKLGSLYSNINLAKLDIALFFSRDNYKQNDMEFHHFTRNILGHKLPSL